MQFWWVNHKQTFKSEIFGGYIWSPFVNKNGSFNQAYSYLKEARVGDIIFSYAHTYLKAVGVISRNYTKAVRPIEYGQLGEQWSKEGYYVKINWVSFDQPIKPKDHLKLIEPLLPQKYSPLQFNGNGNQKIYLAKISDELGDLLMRLVFLANPDVYDNLRLAKEKADEDLEEFSIINSRIPETEKIQLIKARRGQGIFRDNVFNFERCCRITQLSEKKALIASHIRPWRYSNNFEKLDGNNGLLLSPHVDLLFDRGWISFSNKGFLLIANNNTKKILRLWFIDENLNVGPFNNKQSEYLEFHRDKIFKVGK